MRMGNGNKEIFLSGYASIWHRKTNNKKKHSFRRTEVLELGRIKSNVAFRKEVWLNVKYTAP